MRPSLTLLPLLPLLLAACSSPTSDDPNSTTSHGLRNSPAVTPLGTHADTALSPPPRRGPRPASAATDPKAPASGLNAGTIEWPAAFTPGAPCEAVAQKAATIRMRPAATAAQFGQLTVGDKVQLVAQTADGWVGFSPGTAQAGNAGIFRLRWVRASEAFGSTNSCGQLPVATAPPAGCLLMAARPTLVREQPASGAGVLGTIPAGSYAQVAQPAGQWVEVLVPGRDVHGYVAANDASFTGPCE